MQKHREVESEGIDEVRSQWRRPSPMAHRIYAPRDARHDEDGHADDGERGAGRAAA